MDEWKLVEKDEQDEGPYWVCFSDSGKKDEFWSYASVKWDGCIDMRLRSNDPASDKDEDLLHICDIDQFIAKLQALKAEAKKILGPRHGLYEET